MLDAGINTIFSNPSLHKLGNIVGKEQEEKSSVLCNYHNCHNFCHTYVTTVSTVNTFVGHLFLIISNLLDREGQSQVNLSVNNILSQRFIAVNIICTQEDYSVKIIYSQRDISVKIMFNQRDISVNINVIRSYISVNINIIFGQKLNRCSLKYLSESLERKKF